MANEVKARTARRKTSNKAETEQAAAKPAKKAKTDSKTGVAKPAGKAASKPRKTASKLPITPEVRLRHIEVAAYYIAEKRGFADGDTAEDWLTAERQVDHLLLSGKLPT